jgi:hypothetical protein
MRDLSPSVRDPGTDFFRRVSDATERINIAGLCDPARRNWYPVDLEDTVRTAEKLGLTPHDLRAALEKMIPVMQNSECRMQTQSEF